MKKIKSVLFAIIAAASLSSCTLDSASFGVSAVNYPSYPVHRVRTHVHQPAIYYTPSYRHVDVRPDWMRYGSHYCPPSRRQYRHH